MLSLCRAAARSAGAHRALPAGTRGYRHWWKTLMKSNPVDLGFVDSYWYWRIRAETTLLDPENLPKKSYKQLARDMGLVTVNAEAEHMMGIIELYEYLKGSPVVVPAIATERVVGCTGGTGDNEHVPLFFRCE